MCRSRGRMLSSPTWRALSRRGGGKTDAPTDVGPIDGRAEAAATTPGGAVGGAGSGGCAMAGGAAPSGAWLLAVRLLVVRERTSVLFSILTTAQPTLAFVVDHEMDKLRLLLILALVALGAASCSSRCASFAPVPDDSPACKQRPASNGCVCMTNTDCLSGRCAGKASYTACVGICESAPLFVGIGDRCDCEGTCSSGSACLEVCPAGTYCTGFADGDRCAPLEDVGGRCVPDVAETHCRAGLVCARGAGSTATCQKLPLPLHRGDPCPMMGASCGPGLWCDPYAGSTCQPQVVEQPCRVDEDCPQFATCTVECGQTGLRCCTPSFLGAICTRQTGCAHQLLYCSVLANTCQPRRLVGAACDPADSPDQCVIIYSSPDGPICDAKTGTCVGQCEAR